jgi:hypothetical protein
MYRCVVEGTPEGPGKSSSASLGCISEMAARGRHESCAVSRGAPFPCPGLTAIVKQPDATLAAPQPEPQHPAPQTAEPAASSHPAQNDPPHDASAAPEAEKPAKVPRTVEELAGQTVRSSQEGITKAGEAIGGTAKKAGEQIGNAGSAIGNAASTTWTCITSLFSSCGGAGEAEDHPAPEDPASN